MRKKRNHMYVCFRGDSLIYQLVEFVQSSDKYEKCQISLRIFYACLIYLLVLWICNLDVEFDLYYNPEYFDFLSKNI